MEARDAATILSIASPWPIAITLATYLPAGDLINLARTSVLLRAALHGLQPPSARDLQVLLHSQSRPALRIGNHQTSYWKQLKQAAPFLCASPTHTKGSSPRPCRFCSTPICEACIVRDSFAKRAENTFKNRYRFLCKDCWNSGNLHRRCRFKDEPVLPPDGPSRYNFAPGDGEFCGCTNKDNGWVCISCKDMQNAEANAGGFRLCFGLGCTAILEEDKDRRRICLWCDRPMLRGRASMESRLAFDQKMQDARARRGLSFEDRTRKQQKLYKMSRRELRGDEAVAQDLEADAPQFVRHLDTINYQRFMRREHTPSGEQVYQSKMGRWVYHQSFLLKIGKWCKKLPKRDDVRNLTRGSGEQLEKTNLEKSEQRDERRQKEQHGELDCMTSQDADFGSILHMRSSDIAEGSDLQQLRRSFFLPAEAKAAEHDEGGLLESESLQDLNADYAAALALQAELDREMAESLDAEFAADAAQEVGITQVEGELADSDSDEESTHALKSRNIAAEESRDVQDRGYTLQGKKGEVPLSRSQQQLENMFGHASDLQDRVHPSALRLSGSLVASEQVPEPAAAGDELSNLASSQTQPKMDAVQSGNEAHVEHSPAQSFLDDRPPAYAG
jgi:hypothetical protein